MLKYDQTNIIRLKLPSSRPLHTSRPLQNVTIRQNFCQSHPPKRFLLILLVSVVFVVGELCANRKEFSAQTHTHINKLPLEHRYCQLRGCWQREIPTPTMRCAILRAQHFLASRPEDEDQRMMNLALRAHGSTKAFLANGKPKINRCGSLIFGGWDGVGWQRGHSPSHEACVFRVTVNSPVFRVGFFHRRKRVDK